MKAFIRYNLSGDVIERQTFDSLQPKINITGEKVRITTIDHKTYVGFMRTYLQISMPKLLEIYRYDLDEETATLRGSDGSTIFMPMEIIEKIEAISHSNPRWGTRPTNKFTFSSTVRFDPNSDLFKDWPTKKE